MLVGKKELVGKNFFFVAGDDSFVGWKTNLSVGKKCRSEIVLSVGIFFLGWIKKVLSVEKRLSVAKTKVGWKKKIVSWKSFCRVRFFLLVGEQGFFSWEKLCQLEKSRLGEKMSVDKPFCLLNFFVAGWRKKCCRLKFFFAC